jgi:hypothetical protein
MGLVYLYFTLYLTLKNAVYCLLPYGRDLHVKLSVAQHASLPLLTPIRTPHSFWNYPIDPIYYQTLGNAQEYSRKMEMENWPRQGLYFVACRAAVG